jgi:hypothetical protein
MEFETWSGIKEKLSGAYTVFGDYITDPHIQVSLGILAVAALLFVWRPSPVLWYRWQLRVKRPRFTPRMSDGELDRQLRAAQTIATRNLVENWYYQGRLDKQQRARAYRDLAMSYALPDLMPPPPISKVKDGIRYRNRIAIEAKRLAIPEYVSPVAQVVPKLRNVIRRVRKDKPAKAA